MSRNLLLICFMALTQIFAVSSQAKMIFPGVTTVLWPQTSPLEPKAASRLVYYGGPVIEQVKGYTVFWGPSVAAETQKNITKFYTDYVSSIHMDWLSEYKTDVKAVDGREGTHQGIKRGSWMGEATIQPSTNSKQLDDTDVQKQIEHQIDIGVLPIPDKNTLYMVHFPNDIQIQIDGMSSCISFGGYHFNFQSSKYGDIFYAVLPDCSFMTKTMDSFQSMTFVGSHELIEAVTDAKPTAGSNPSFPQAWNTTGGEEIADLCPSAPVQFSFPTGKYLISREWSNSRNKCFDGSN